MIGAASWSRAGLPPVIIGLVPAPASPSVTRPVAVVSCARAGAATEDDALVSLSVRAEPYSPQLGPGRLSRALIGQPRRNTRV